MLAVDIYSGCGGLTLGLRNGGAEVGAAVELDRRSAETYRANHPGVNLIESDIRDVTSKDVFDALGGKAPDLVVGCAPCQGFSSLTAKNQRADPRNQLLLEMARLVEGLLPEVVFMENVPGLQNRGKGILQQFTDRLRRLGYMVNQQVVQMADFGVPQYRRRFVLAAGRGFYVPLPLPTHQRVAKNGRAAWVPIREVIGNRPPPATLAEARRNGGPVQHDWHVVRNLQPQTIKRLQMAIPGGTWEDYPEEVRPPCHRGGYRGFQNVYGRMRWEQPSVTITSGCTTPAMGRFGHPDPLRTTISVREAADIQTFPHDYKFICEYMDSTCGMIGNAVPPLFAEAVTQSIYATLNSHRGAVARKS